MRTYFHLDIACHKIKNEYLDTKTFKPVGHLSSKPLTNGMQHTPLVQLGLPFYFIFFLSNYFNTALYNSNGRNKEASTFQTFIKNRSIPIKFNFQLQFHPTELLNTFDIQVLFHLYMSIYFLVLSQQLISLVVFSSCHFSPLLHIQNYYPILRMSLLTLFSAQLKAKLNTHTHAHSLPAYSTQLAKTFLEYDYHLHLLYFTDVVSVCVYYSTRLP